jgi:chorismate mutase
LDQNFDRGLNAGEELNQLIIRRKTERHIEQAIQVIRQQTNICEGKDLEDVTVPMKDIQRAKKRDNVRIIDQQQFNVDITLIYCVDVPIKI